MNHTSEGVHHWLSWEGVEPERDYFVMFGVPSEIRTQTEEGLNLLPLPVGLMGHMGHMVGPRGIEPVSYRL